MRCSALRIISLGSFLLLASSTVFAQCTEDRRRVELGQNVVQLRTYLCRTGQGSEKAQIRIEIDRLSDLAAGMIVSKRPTAILTQTIGAPKLLDNDVSNTYSELLKRFGSALERGSFLLAVEAAGAGGEGSLKAPAEGGKILGGQSNYPAIEEIDALKRKTIPSGLKYFYSVVCHDNETIEGRRTSSLCNRYDPQDVTMIFWRSMNQGDVTNYSRRMTAYNRRFAPKDHPDSVAIPRELRLANHLAGNNWPDDFMIMTGTAEGGCLWGFSYELDFLLDVAILENVSKVPIAVNDMLGDWATDSGLRVASTSVPHANAIHPLGLIVETLAPGEKVLLPLRILVGHKNSTTQEFRYRETAGQIHRQLGASKFTGNRFATHPE